MTARAKLGPRLGARLWWGLVPLALLLWGAGALAPPILAGSAGGASTGSPDGSSGGLSAGFGPWLTSLLRPAVEFAAVIAVAVAVGAVVVLVWVESARLRRWALGWVVAAAALSAAAMVLLTADVLGVGPFDGGVTQALVPVVETLAAGQYRLVQLAALVLALPLVALGRRTPPLLAAVALLLVAAAAPSASGHTGLSGEHAVASVAVALHVAAVSAWIGGLAVVVMLLRVEPDRAPAVLPHFSVLALACVIVAAETGLLASDLLVGSVTDLLGSTYGSVVLAKVTLLAWLVLLGYQQRRRAVDLLPHRSVPQVVAVIAAVELVVMGAAVAAGVALSRIGPPVVAGSGFAPLAVVMLAVGMPMLAVAVRPGGFGWGRSLPEVAAIVLLLAIVEVGGVGLLRTLFGTLGLAVELALLVFCGWLAVSSVADRRAVVVLAVGLPCALAAATALSHRFDGTRMTVVAIVCAEVFLGLWWRRLRRAEPTSEGDSPGMPAVAEEVPA